MPVITALEVQQNNSERVNVYLDEAYAFSLDVMTASGLRRGQALSEADIAALREQDTLTQAVDRAVRFLAHRPRSEAEVRRRLAEKNVPDPVITATIAHLQHLGYLDDEAFAAFWVENRSAFRPLSPRALRYELRQKGVSDATIQDALADLDPHDLAYRAAQPQARRQRGQTRRSFRNKIGSFLQRRGFDYETIHTVVEQLITELETDDPEFFLTDEE
jgi:regulatory protein